MVFFDSTVLTATTSAAATTGLAASTTSRGRYIAISLHLSPPPAISYLHLDTDDDPCGVTSVVAADADLLLIHAVLAVGRRPPLLLLPAPLLRLQIPPSPPVADVSKGVVKFVDVDNGFCGRIKSSGFTVTTWTLRMPELVWEKDGVMRVNDLWSSCREFRQSLVPRWPPERPVVSKGDPDAVHFILKKCGLRNKPWLITLHTREMAMRSYMRYADPGVEALRSSMWWDPEDEEWRDNSDDDDDGGVTTFFSGSLLISSALSSALPEHGCRGTRYPFRLEDVKTENLEENLLPFLDSFQWTLLMAILCVLYDLRISGLVVSQVV